MNGTKARHAAGKKRWQHPFSDSHWCLKLSLVFLAFTLVSGGRLHSQCPVPTITCAPNKTVECGTIWTNDPPAVVDSCCGPLYTLSFSAATSGICPQLIAFKWVLTNCFTNIASCTQTVTVVDTMPPGIFCNPNKTVTCTTPWTFDAPTNFDSCCGTNVSLRILSTFTNNVGCTMFATRSWQAVDCCSNLSAICTQMVTVIETAPPLLSCAPNKTVECGTAWVFDPPTALTCCGTNAAVITIGTFTNNGTCTQMLARVWQAASCCGNITVMCTQMVTVVDTTPPMLTCGTNKTVACGAPWTFDPPAALDSCCGASVTVTLLSTVTNGGPCPMIATRAWKATDCCSNSITCTQTVLVLDKWLQIPDTSTNGLDVKATDPKILADDFLCHATGPITKVRIWGSWLNDAVPPPPCFCLGLWSDVPRSGTNYSRPGPQLCSYCAGPGQYTNFVYTNALFERFYDPNIPGTNGLIGTDTAIWEYVFDIPTNIPCWYQTNGNIYWLSVTADCFPTNQFIFGWKTSPTNWNDDAVYGDSLGFGGPPTNWFPLTRPGTTNSLDLAFEITTLTNSCPPPSLVCATNKTVICEAPWSFDPPLVFDACCGTNFTVTTTTFTNGSICPPVVTRFWTVTDCLGSMGFCTQSVTLIVTAPPLLICSNKTIQCGTPFTNDPPKAFSLCCGTNVTIMPLGGTSTAGTCTQVMSQTWQAMDCCGNLSGMCTQTITIVDTTPPTLTCASNKTVQCGTPWLFDPPTAFDTCCGTNVFIGIVTTFTNGGACTQIVSRVWQAADCCSNLSATCTQAVTVVDNIPPDITCPSNIVVLTCSTNVAVSWSVTAGDACSLVTVTSSPPSGTFFSRDTTNTVTATATDVCGNTNSCSFQVIVRRPTITIGIGLGVPPTNVILSWVDGGVLEDATNIVGLWTPRPLATSPYTNAITTVQRFYRLRCP